MEQRMSNIKKVIAVIGANYGDEGKGKMVSYFCNRYKNEAPIVVRYNGGAQAAHRVRLPNGKYHIFGHFGSGTGFNIPTFLYKDFILNPVLMNVEGAELTAKIKDLKTHILVDSSCDMVTTPWDMKFNQIVEESRGNSRHGSCGVGIFSTLRRSRGPNGCPASVPDFVSPATRESRCNAIVNWYRYHLINEMDEITYSKVTSDPVFTVGSEEHRNVMARFMMDLDKFLYSVNLVTLGAIQNYQTVIFEGAQGLAISSHIRSGKNRTPSNTGACTPAYIMASLNANSQVEDDKQGIIRGELVYTSRTYLTRHGAGELPEEIENETGEWTSEPGNPENKFQGKFRHAKFTNDSSDSMYHRTVQDSGMAENIKAYNSMTGKLEHSMVNWDVKMAITCCDKIPIDSSHPLFKRIGKDAYLSFTDGFTLTE
jgi:adenylosuccinate synthase